MPRMLMLHKLAYLLGEHVARLSRSAVTASVRRAVNPWSVAIGLLTILTSPAFSQAEDWPGWRGPHGDNSSRETGLPIIWSESRGIAWKTPIPPWGTSTPTIWKGNLFLTTQHDDALLVLKLRASDGSMEWTKQFAVATVERKGTDRGRQKFHDLHNLASPSPVTDGKYVVVHFGNGDLAAYDFAGELVWQHNLQRDFGTYTIWWGHANSPVLYKNLVISICMQDSLDDQSDTPAASYLVAHDIATGEQRWMTPRMTGAQAEEGDAYTTPVLAKVEGREQLIVMGANTLDGYDPNTGEQLWYLPGLVGGRTVTGPTVGNGAVYATRGMRGPLIAMKLGGRGKLTNRDILWHYDQGTPDSCSPVLSGGLLFTVTDDGIARVFDAESGRMHKKIRLKGDYKATPLVAEKRIYFLNTSGLCTVVSASEKLEKLAENQLGEDTLSSLAVSGGRIYLRGRDMLYALGKK